ncbi:hypothetical protein BJ912DRAFT_1143304 [Pholiota molesta]|nr:hypothetical protein BJ912DRAFT_1143304 [Pholiota molesta]
MLTESTMPWNEVLRKKIPARHQYSHRIGAVYSLSLLVIGVTSVFPGASNPLNTRSVAFETTQQRLYLLSQEWR